jgi:hypothetical protein
MPKIGKYDFPTFDIDSVLEKLDAAHKTIGIQEMDRENIAISLNMAPRGGGFAYLISDMEKYGLVEMGHGKVKITNLGMEAIYGSLKEREEAKNKAVGRIGLLSELFSQFGSNITEEQIRAFLRQKAEIDVMKAQKMAEKVYKIYKRVAIYITPAKLPEQASLEPADMGRSEPVVAPTEIKSQFLKIQFGDVYIQIPPDDLKAISMAKDALEFMENRIKSEKKELEK